jgi:TctA family transporter
MAKKGEAGRAMGAALMSSLVGALIGAASLAIAIPVIRPIVLALGSPETFMMIIVGLSCISSLSGRGNHGVLLGMMAGGFGLMCSLVGQDPQNGILRFTFGQLYLWNGLGLVPVLIGLFALPEIMELGIKRTAIADKTSFGQIRKGVMNGIIDTFRNFWLVVRCSLIGTWIGILPGLGPATSQWMAYAHASQSYKTAEERRRFGKGEVRGVLGPGAANNSTATAATIPTVAFGIPGSFGTAILLGAFFLLGITPGPDMLTKNLSLIFSIVWTIVLANIVIVAASLLFITHLARITTIRGNILIPNILLLAFIGGFSGSNHLADLLVLLLFGGIGYLMVRFSWPRAPFVLGFLLGNLAEINLYASTSRYGVSWVFRPGVIVLFVLALIVTLYPYFSGKKVERKEAAEGHRNNRDQVTSNGRRHWRYSGKALMSLVLMVIGAWMTITALKWPLKTSLFPLVVGISTFFIAMVHSSLCLFGKEKDDRETKGSDFEFYEDIVRKKTLSTCFWILSFFLLIVLVGFMVAIPIFFIFYFKLSGKEKWKSCLGLTAATWGTFYLLFIQLFHFPFPQGWIQKWLMAVTMG